MNKTMLMRYGALALTGLLAVGAPLLRAQESEQLTLKRAVELALQNSREVALARAEYDAAAKAVDFNRSFFLPNLYTGSGAAYTNGFPQTPGGAAPSLFNLSYVQALFNAPARGQLRAAEQRREARRLAMEQARAGVILRTLSACLELGMARGSLQLLGKQRESAQKIAAFTRERAGQGLELAVEVTRADLSVARIALRMAQLGSREEALEAELHALTGLPPARRLETAPEELQVGQQRPPGELIDLALTNDLELQQAEYERRAREQRVEGERGGYWPSVDLVGEYSILSRLNNYDEFFRRFQRHNLNVGVQVKIPIFSSQTSAAVALARSELAVAEADLNNRRAGIESAVRRQAGRVRELEAGREVARLELKLAQENVLVLQARFEEGRASLRDLEAARLEESDRWLAFLDAGFDYQQAQLELFKSTGQLAGMFQP